MITVSRFLAWLGRQGMARRPPQRASQMLDFVGPPDPPGTRREALQGRRPYLQVSRWNRDHTVHTLDFRTLDGQPLPRWDDETGQ